MPTQMTDQLVEAGVLLAVGMSVVFAFLTLLIGGVYLISWYCRKFPSSEAPKHAMQNAGQQKHIDSSSQKPSTSVSPQIAAAISAAVHTHRQSTLKS
jgi:oxaloacetate decarboxylase gamma subunit